jgi:transcriptional regulator with XRE-family HTH domain
MSISDNIRKIRENKGLQQKQVALEVEIGISHYNRMEKGEREVSVKVLERLAKLYGMTIDQIINLNNDIPQEVIIEDKTATEQVRLIAQLNDKDKSTVMNIIDTMLTKQKFQNFFEQNIQIAK